MGEGRDTLEGRFKILGEGRHFGPMLIISTGETGKGRSSFLQLHPILSAIICWTRNLPYPLPPSIFFNETHRVALCAPTISDRTGLCQLKV